jgi:hypothetical protein
MLALVAIMAIIAMALNRIVSKTKCRSFHSHSFNIYLCLKLNHLFLKLFN